MKMVGAYFEKIDLKRRCWLSVFVMSHASVILFIYHPTFQSHFLKLVRNVEKDYYNDFDQRSY